MLPMRDALPTINHSRRNTAAGWTGGRGGSYPRDDQGVLTLLEQVGELDGSESALESIGPR